MAADVEVQDGVGTPPLARCSVQVVAGPCVVGPGEGADAACGAARGFGRDMRHWGRA
jgi:hypothetical protein